jgi:DNA end-binding protein Ku
MARAVWKGAISFGLVHVPIELYPAESRNEFKFTMLDRRDLAPVGYQRVNKKSGKEVPWDDIVKGYEYEDDRYVVLTDEDFRRANVTATQTVEIFGFADTCSIPDHYFEQPYVLVPGRRGEKGYALLRDALRRTERVGLATVVIRARQHVCTVAPVGDQILLNTLRYASELEAMKTHAVETPAKGNAYSARELEMAERLVREMEEAFDPAAYKDHYHGDLMKRIRAKLKC